MRSYNFQAMLQLDEGSWAEIPSQVIDRFTNLIENRVQELMDAQVDGVVDVSLDSYTLPQRLAQLMFLYEEWSRHEAADLLAGTDIDPDIELDEILDNDFDERLERQRQRVEEERQAREDAYDDD